ncbi:hypothetical protein BBP40_012393 [Aspergillus hancockii]|nr:hypothetical protein BBP40_012393 [Aspergillus hancockii]
MPSDPREEYRLSRLSPSDPDRAEPTWSPFGPTDRAYIRYERAPSHQEQDITSHNEAPPTVGLGINNLKRRPASIHFTEEFDRTHHGGDARSPQYSDQHTPRSHTSKTPLIDGEPYGVRCAHKDAIVQKWYRWVPITILVLAVWATVWSGLYFVMACWKPRYGTYIGVGGKLSASTANLLSALFAKMIELSYVTVFVAFLGQFLSRRALRKGSHGITISDMSMRTWIMQPGSMIVHWETLRYSALSLLGAMTLTATIVAMFYTTAAEALVSPKLLMGPRLDRTLMGNVSTDFFNPDFLGWHCSTPIVLSDDPENRNSTCLQLQHVGQAYHNYVAYLSEWSKMVVNHNPASTIIKERPPPIGSIHDNTTVVGSWIDRTNMTELSSLHGRMVLNVTAAMPHAGVLGAVKDPRNGVKSPQNSSEGNFEIVASVPCPAVNVLCVGMTEDELKPLVYSLWPGTKFNQTTWMNKTAPHVPQPEDAWYNRTVVDDLFGWGPKYNRTQPIFGKLPLPYNTIVNGTMFFPHETVYLLGAPPLNKVSQYTLCGLKAKKTPRCSVNYTASASGARFTTDCERADNEWQYDWAHPDSPDGNWSTDWKNIASEWANSLSLSSGINDGYASNGRLLMQLTPSSLSLDPDLPSLAEALAVMAGSTLIMGTENAPFVPYWNHSVASIPEPDIQHFNASMSVVEYQSSGTERWQGIFYPVLILTFVTSALCLVYLLLERGKQLTDFTEPQNLFALAINSPATSRLEGSCGAGPHGNQFKEKWYVGMEEDDWHYYIRTKAEEHTPLISMAKVSMDDEDPKSASPALEEYRRLSTGQGWLGRWY